MLEFFQSMSVYEALMLICFGASWPLAILKTYKSKNVEGKSILFLGLVLFGYIFGTLNKILNNYDPVIYLYILNGLFVLIDIFLWCVYKKRNAKA